MSRKYIYIGLLIIAAAGSGSAETPPMVDRHIFTPENVAEQKQDAAPGPVDGSDLFKDIQFTGVMNTGKGKLAILTEASKNDKNKKNHVVKEGDSIKGMIIKEIGPNYVLLVTKENTAKLNLFKSGKTRPIPPAEPVSPNPLATPSELQQNQSKSLNPAAVQQQMPPLGTGISEVKPNKAPIGNQSLPMPVIDPGAVTVGGPDRGISNPQVTDPGNNPFADAMNKASEINSPPGAPRGRTGNPFVMPAN